MKLDVSIFVGVLSDNSHIGDTSDSSVSRNNQAITWSGWFAEIRGDVTTT